MMIKKSHIIAAISVLVAVALIIAIGVPTLIDYNTKKREATAKAQEAYDLIGTPLSNTMGIASFEFYDFSPIENAIKACSMDYVSKEMKEKGKKLEHDYKHYWALNESMMELNNNYDSDSIRKGQELLLTALEHEDLNISNTSIEDIYGTPSEYDDPISLENSAIYYLKDSLENYIINQMAFELKDKIEPGMIDGDEDKNILPGNIFAGTFDYIYGTTPALMDAESEIVSVSIIDPSTGWRNQQIELEVKTSTFNDARGNCDNSPIAIGLFDDEVRTFEPGEIFNGVYGSYGFSIRYARPYEVVLNNQSTDTEILWDLKKSDGTKIMGGVTTDYILDKPAWFSQDS